MESTSCRICFTTEKIKLLSLFNVKMEDKTIAEWTIFCSGIEVKYFENNCFYLFVYKHFFL